MSLHLKPPEADQKGAYLLLCDHIGQPNPDGTEDASIALHKDGAHAKVLRDGACMLAARAAKTGEAVLRHVVALHLRQRADRPTHRLIRHAYKAHRHLRTRPSSRCTSMFFTP